MNLLPYIFEYFKTNHLTFFLLLSLLLLPSLKYLKIQITISPRIVLWMVLLLGLFLRIGWLGFSSHTPKMSWDRQHMLESDVANIHAIELTKGIWFEDADGKPSGRRPIGYPVFLGLLYKIFGVNLAVPRVMHLILFVISGYLIFLITELIFTQRTALSAAALFSVFPVSIYSTVLLTDEHLFLPLWYLGLYLLLREIKGAAVPWALFWYGIVFGYATMTRTHSIFMPAVVAFTYFLLKYPWRKVVMGFVTVLFFMQLINLPWIIRNYKVWGIPVLYTTTAGYIYSQVNSSATPEGGGHIPQKGEPGFSQELQDALVSGNGARYHSLCNREMKRWIISHPKEFFFLGTARILIFMSWNRAGGVWPLWFQYYEGSYDPVRPISSKLKGFFEETAFAFYYELLFLFLFSIVYMIFHRQKMSRASKMSLLMLGSCFLFWLLEHMLIYPDKKYRFPLEPLMMVIASIFLDYLLFTFKWRDWKMKIMKHRPENQAV